MLNFQEQLPDARFIMSLLTRNTAPMCSKPLLQEAADCSSLCQQMDVLRPVSFSLNSVPKSESL